MKKLLLLLLLVGCGPSQFEKEKALREKEFLQIAKDCLFTIELAQQSQHRNAESHLVAFRLAKDSSNKLKKELDKVPAIRSNKRLNAIRNSLVLVADSFESISNCTTAETHRDALHRLDKTIDNLKSSMTAEN